MEPNREQLIEVMGKDEAELARLKEELEKLEKSNEENEKIVNDLREKLLDRLVDNRDELQKQYDKIQYDIQSYETRRRSIEAEIEQLTKRIEDNKIKLAAEEIKNNEKAIEDLKEQKENLDRNSQTYKKESAAIQKEIKEQTKTIKSNEDILADKFEQNINWLYNHRSELDALEAQLKTIPVGQSHGIKYKIDALRAEISEKEKEIIAIREQLGEKKAQNVLKTMQDKKAQNMGDAEALMDWLSRRVNKLNSLKAELKTTNDAQRRYELVNEIDALEKDVLEAQKKLRAIMNELGPEDAEKLRKFMSETGINTTTPGGTDDKDETKQEKDLSNEEQKNALEEMLENLDQFKQNTAKLIAQKEEELKKIQAELINATNDNEIGRFSELSEKFKNINQDLAELRKGLKDLDELMNDVKETLENIEELSNEKIAELLNEFEARFTEISNSLINKGVEKPISTRKKTQQTDEEKLKEQIEKINALLNKAEKDLDINAFRQAMDLINTLPDGEIKEELRKKAQEIAQKIANALSQISKEITELLDKAEKDLDKDALDAARKLIEKLPEGEKKEEFKARADKISALIKKGGTGGGGGTDTEDPEPPKKIENSPKKTWKTWVALAAGVGIGVGVFYVFGGMGVTAMALVGGLSKFMLKKRRKKLELQRLNGELPVENIEEPLPGIKGIIQKVKAYFKSEEFCRDAEWLINGAIYTGMALNMASMIKDMVIAAKTPEIPIGDDMVTSPDITGTQPDAALDAIRPGASVEGYDLTKGYDTADWALNGTHAETLNSTYINGQNSMMGGLRVTNLDGTHTYITDSSISVNDLVNKGVDIKDIAVNVVRAKDGAAQAWKPAMDFTESVEKAIGGGMSHS